MTAPTQPAPLRPPRSASGRRALLGRSNALDGLRGLALTWVVVYHFTSASGPIPGAWVGLDVFFVLSGFLITAMLLDEHRVNGRISMGLFYARRAFRLLPALFVMLGIWTVLLLLFHDTTWFAATPGGDGVGDPVDVGDALRQVGIVLVYGVNWVYALGSGDAPIAHLWSLAVEEQFYVVWPWAVLLLLKLPAARRIWPVLVLAALSASLPLFYYDGGAGTNRIYFGTDTRAVGMLLGAVAALAWHRRRSAGTVGLPAPTARAWAGLATVILFLLTVGNIPLKSLAGPAIMGLAVMQVVPYLVDRPASVMGQFFNRPVLVWLGQRSYAIYLWHYLFATWLNPFSYWVSLPVGFAASLAAGWLSWRYVEAPALEYAKRFRPQPAPTQPLAADSRRESLAA